MLTAKVLKFFADCPEINTLDLGPTYASRMNEFGLIENGILSAKKCTAPLFTGYGRLKVLDLTNVLIGDDELRYLIKLQSLEAIGLAGTKVTNKGLKYLAKHALFKPRLMCIKLCYNDQIDDESLVVLRKFEQLTEIDLWGCSKIQMEGCIALLQGPNRIQKVRLPIHLEKRINELHVYYAKADSSIVSSPKVSMELSETDMIRQLKFHKSQFPDVFLNLAKEDLRSKLFNILTIRKIQEKMYKMSY